MGVNALVAACPPLDTNSVYCNLLQCTHFSQTCALAEMDGAVVGFLSAYLMPERPNRLFVWQVAVGEAARGKGLARKLLAEVVGRPQCQNIRYVQTTITEDNEASWAMFESFAKIVGAPTKREELFDSQEHFNGEHASEILLTIGPFQPWQVIAKTRHERVS